MRGEDHGALDYWAMFFVLIIAVGVWMWIGGYGLTAKLVVTGIGVAGLLVTLALIRKM
jgi:hypothetical protein